MHKTKEERTYLHQQTVTQTRSHLPEYLKNTHTVLSPSKLKFLVQQKSLWVFVNRNPWLLGVTEVLQELLFSFKIFRLPKGTLMFLMLEFILLRVILLQV